MAERENWVRVTIPPEVDRLARLRCHGYNFDASKSQQELMRDCYVQGIIDGAAVAARLEPRREP